MYVCVCVKAWPHLVVAWTGTLPIHCYHPLILSSVRPPCCFPASCFYFDRKLRSGRRDSLVPRPRPYLPRCDLNWQVWLESLWAAWRPLEELHFSLWCHYMRPELYVVVSLRSSSLRDKRSVLEINFVLNDKPDNILHFLIINKSYEKTKTNNNFIWLRSLDTFLSLDLV